METLPHPYPSTQPRQQQTQCHHPIHIPILQHVNDAADQQLSKFPVYSSSEHMQKKKKNNRGGYHSPCAENQMTANSIACCRFNHFKSVKISTW